jgi:hypothetical protein
MCDLVRMVLRRRYSLPALTLMLPVFMAVSSTNPILTGQVPFVLIISGALAFPISFFLIKFYRRAPRP